jgi:predicted TIM-barrel fold metal-dependent hydrolase
MQAWGWHADTAVHLPRLYVSGLFDKFPMLKIVTGHNGEMLSFMVERVESRLTNNWGSHVRGWLTMWAENVLVTASWMFYMAQFAD